MYYGSIDVGGHQLAVQLVGICYAIGWSFIVSYAILQAIDKTIGLRVSEEDEEEGLDSSIHGEANSATAMKESAFTKGEVGVAGESIA